MNTGVPQQRPLGFTAVVRSTPSPQHAARLDMRGDRSTSEPPIAPEEKSFDPTLKR